MDREAYFATRKWRVATEVTGRWEVDDQQVSFMEGKFSISPPGAYRSPLGTPGRPGNLGRHGVLLQEVGPDGADIEGSAVAFGEAVVEQARKDFNAIV